MADPKLCPGCNAALTVNGTRLNCAACGGAFVSSDDLTEMLTSMAPDDLRSLDDRFPLGAVGARACPSCKTAMPVVRLGKLEIDRCGTHGVWFDQNELARTLEADGNSYANREEARTNPMPVGGQGLLVRIFYKIFTSPNRPRDLDQPPPAKK